VARLGTIIAGAAIMLLAMAVAVTGYLAADRLVPLSVRQSHNEVAGFIYAFIGPLYAILLAFVVFVVWGYFEEARSAAATEATDLYRIYSISRSMGSDFSGQVQQAALAYASSVVNDEWPAMGRGEAETLTAREKYGILRNLIEIYTPTNNRESNLHAAELTNLDDLAAARTQRVLKSGDVLHPALWVALLAGALISVGYSYFFGIENRFAHALMVGVLALSISGMLFLIDSIGSPYRGDVRVGPSAMQEVSNDIANPVPIPSSEP
jgi:hypothetical protein